MNDFEALMEAVIQKAKATANIDEGDYVGEDNLYYCGKCQTRKQTVIKLFGKTRVVPCVCKCEADKIKAEEAACELAQKLMRMRSVGFPERAMLEWTFENDDGSNPTLTNAMKNFVEHFTTFKEEGKGLLLFGNVGTGKTYLAACVANALINKGIPCLVTSVTRITNELQDRFEGRQQILDNLNTFPLLVLDDLKAERNTEYMQEMVFNIIDARYRANLPLIVTTNLTRERLLNPQNLSDERIFSRLFEMCTPIEVSGQDRRQKALREDIGKMKSLLGLQ